MCGLWNEHCVSRIKVPQFILGVGVEKKEQGGERSLFSSSSPQQPRPKPLQNSVCLQLCRTPLSKDASRHSLLCGLPCHICKWWGTYSVWGQEQLEHTVLQLLLCYGCYGKHYCPLPSQLASGLKVEKQPKRSVTANFFPWRTLWTSLYFCKIQPWFMSQEDGVKP